MTSISGSVSSASHSPLARLQAELTSEIKAGTIKDTDSSALSSALQSIDGPLGSGRFSAGASSSPPDPSEIQSKVSSLIDDQVSAGSLTSDQASELKQLFQNAAPKGGAGGPGGPGAGGPPPPPPSDDSTSDTNSSSDTTSTTSSVQDVLDKFLKQLQTTLSQSYGANGSTTTSNASLVVDFQA